MKLTPPRLTHFGFRSLETVTFLALSAGLVASCEKREAVVSRDLTTEETYALTSSWPTFAQGIDKGASAKMDILFMVDNSFSMAPLQAKLTQSFPRMMAVLQGLPGGTPDLHIGVVSSDLGAGAFNVNDVPGCEHGGDEGKLQFAPRGACTATGLADHFIALHTDPVSGAVVTNYGDQKLEDVLSCIALLGQTGCGFEHQLGSVMRALGVDGRGPAPVENAGFLRDDAYLGIVMVTNEDDCSAPFDSKFFDPASKKIGDPLGPLTSFRCNAFGHLCTRGGHEGAPSMTEAAMYDECRSNEDGPLVKVDAFVNAIKKLKGDPARVFFAAVTGPPLPYGVGLGLTSTDDPAPWPAVAHSCNDPAPPAGDGAYADPAVRLWNATEGFGGQGVFESICNNSFTPSLERIAEGLSAPLGPPCVAVPAGAPGCTVVDRWVDERDQHQTARLPSCDDAGAQKPCWRLSTDAATCLPGELRLVVDRAGTTTPAHLFTAVDCATARP
jgi:hypothetical protein